MDRRRARSGGVVSSAGYTGAAMDGERAPRGACSNSGRASAVKPVRMEPREGTWTADAGRVSARHGLRVAAAGLSYAVFGVGTVLLMLTAFPALWLTLREPVRRGRRLRRVFSGGCRFFIRFMRTLGLLDWEVSGQERLAGRGQLVVANHPSLIDAVFLLAWMPDAVCILKEDLRHNLFLAWAITAAGYVGNADPAHLLQDCVKALRRGDSLIVFPEGTRSVPGQPRRFRRGAARMALDSGAPVIPVRIICDPAVLTKGTPWYRVPARRAHYRFCVDAPQGPFASLPAETLAHAARRVTGELERLLLADGCRGAPGAVHTETP